MTKDEILKKIIEWDGGALLHRAVEEGNVEMTDYLLEHGVDVNVKDDDGDTPLQCAVMTGNVGMTEFLLRHGADVNVKDDDGETTLNIAKRHRKKVIIAMLEAKLTEAEK